MSGSFADIKAQARRDVHSAFAVPCLYFAPDTFWADGVVGTPLNARLHMNLTEFGPLRGSRVLTSTADIIEGINRVVFDAEEVASAALTLVRGGVVQFPAYGANVELDVADPMQGPVNLRWTVTPL